MDNLTIRKATIDDAPELLEYMNKVSRETDYLSVGDETEFTLEDEKEFVQGYEKETDLLLIATLDNQIVSVADFHTPYNPREKHTAHIGISVLKEYWGNGIATSLFEELVTHAKKHNIKIIELQVRSDNKRAKQLYKKWGFTKCGYRRNRIKINNKYYSLTIMDLHL